jgi:undecaprenyl-diphosphatase
LSWFEAVVLGLVQGLTEFLPISSTAHLRIVASLAGWDDPGATFTAVTQIGTEAAVLIYFRHTIARVLRQWAHSLVRPELRGDPDARMGWYVIVGTIPIGIFGITLQVFIRDNFRNLTLVALTLIVFGLILGAADLVAKHTKALDSLNLRDGVLYGLAQSLALIPGVSRSGGTISAGLLLGYTREAAARYAFLLAIPAVLASGFYELRLVGEDGAPAWGPTMAAAAIAFGMGYAVIAWFLRFIHTRSFLPFVLYRVVLGVAILGLIGTGVIDPSSP